MRILITNDDGIMAPGLEVLARNVARWIDEAPTGEVREAIVVAPSKNHSGMSAAVGDVFSHPSVNYERCVIPGAESLVAYSLEAPPALCAILGAVGSFEFQPDLILSGINAGANVGRSVLHSGTIGRDLDRGATRTLRSRGLGAVGRRRPLRHRRRGRHRGPTRAHERAIAHAVQSERARTSRPPT